MRYTDPTGHLGVSTDLYGFKTTYHLNHDEALALWNFINSGEMTIIGLYNAFITGGLAGMAKALSNYGYGGVSGDIAFRALATVLAPMFSAMAAAGMTAAQVVLILMGIGHALVILDDYYGNKGVDVTLNLLPIPYYWVEAPTIERQDGYWFHGKCVFGCLE